MAFIDRIRAARDAFFSSRGGGNSNYPQRFVVAPTSRFNWVAEAGELRANPIIAICLKFGVDAMMEINFKIFGERRSGTKYEVTDHPVLELINSPNPVHDCRDMITHLYTDLMIDGNAYQYMAETYNGSVGELYWFDSRYTAPCIPPDGSAYLTGWKYTPAGTGKTTEYAEEQIIVFRTGADPANDRLGLSPVRAAVKELAISNMVPGYTAGIIKNAGASTLVISPEGQNIFTIDEVRDMRMTAQQRISGENAGSVLVSPVAAKFQGIGTTPAELLLSDVDMNAVARLCAAFGFSPMAVGLPDSMKTYSNYEESLVAAWRHGIKPAIRLLVNKWNYRLMPRFETRRRLEIVPDYSEIDCLAKDMKLVADATSVLFNAGITMQNEARTANGLEEIDGGDIFKHEIAAASKPEFPETGIESGDDNEESPDDELDGDDEQDGEEIAGDREEAA